MLTVSVFELPKVRVVRSIPLVERISFWKSSIIKRHNFLNTLLEGRRWHWECGKKMVESSPLWGIGCGLFEQEYYKYKIKNDMFSIARAHNILIRIFSEGGIVTFVLFLIFLVLSFFRLFRGFSIKAKKAEPEYSFYLQMISVGFTAFFLLSFFSDIILVREECVFFTAILSACAARAYSKLPPINEEKFITIRTAWNKSERKIQHVFRRIGWGYLGKVNLNKMLKIIIVIVLFILFIFGLSNAKLRRLNKLKNGKLTYGYFNRVPGGKSKNKWFSMGKYTSTELTVRKDFFYFGYRAVNEKMAVLDTKLKLYINNIPTATFSLNSTKVRWVCCDVTKIKGQQLKIEFEAEKVFVPLKEHWFADNYSYGAVITRPRWINKKSKQPKDIKKGFWITIE